jgi:hypothetical protein
MSVQRKEFGKPVSTCAKKINCVLLAAWEQGASEQGERHITDGVNIQFILFTYLKKQFVS